MYLQFKEQQSQEAGLAKILQTQTSAPKAKPWKTTSQLKMEQELAKLRQEQAEEVKKHEQQMQSLKLFGKLSSHLK
jgi:hypothetical protein